MSRPRLVVDVRLARSSGHRTYIRNLLPRLASRAPEWRWTLLGDSRFLAGEDWARRMGADAIHCSARVYGAAEQVRIPLSVPRDTRLFWATHYNIPLLLRVPLALTIHDCAHLRLPEYTGSLLRRTYARTMFAAALSRASVVMSDSEFTRREIAELFPGGPDAQVVHLAVDQAWFENAARPNPNAADPYFVFVGNMKPHKGLGILLQALHRAGGDCRERLVIAGSAVMRTPDRTLRDGMRSLGSRVRLAGELGDEELRALVQGATALVMPSRYEGFGLPPLEAMAAGVPVIASRAGSLPEVCGDAAEYFERDDAPGLADALVRVSRDETLRASLVERGRAQARRFDWDRAATRTLALLRQAMDLSAARSPGSG